MRVGELVAAWDSATGKARWRPIMSRSMREAPQVMRLTVRDEAGRVETVVVTPNHPYLRPDGSYDLLKAVSMEPGGDWSAAGRLSPGDRVASVSGRTLEVVASEVDLSPARVYNLEVAGDHTYAVGELQAWVHNATKTPSRKNPNQSDPNDVRTIPGKQVRIYGPDGLPLLDIDLDHCHGQGRPHQHNWPGPKNRSTGTKVPTRPFPNKPPL